MAIAELVIRHSESCECAMDPTHVCADPTFEALPDISELILEGTHGRVVRTSPFTLLNEDEMLIWEADHCRSFCQPFEH
jgi:hypothetical protein